MPALTLVVMWKSSGCLTVSFASNFLAYSLLYNNSKQTFASLIVHNIPQDFPFFADVALRLMWRLAEKNLEQEVE